MRKRKEINASCRRLAAVMLSGSYQVPEYQRNYDWEPRNVADLLEDLQEAMKEGVAEYFLGTIMLVPRTQETRGGGYNWYINDGQQRLVTCTLIFAKLAQLLGGSRNVSCSKLRSDLYERCFLDFKDKFLPKAQEKYLPNWTPRIVAPAEDIFAFTTLLRNHDLAGDTKLFRAWKEIGKFFSDPRYDKIAWRKKFANYILNDVSVVQLNVPDSFDLHAIFETLNARGKPLDEIDLFKNYCLQRAAMCGKGKGDDAKKGFELLEKGLKRKKLITEYVRCHMQSRFGHLPEKNMFRNMRTAIEKQCGRKGKCNKFTGLLDALYSSNMRLYDMFRHPNNYVEDINQFCGVKMSGSKRQLIDCLRDLSRYTVSFPVLHALFLRCLESDDLAATELLSASQLLSSFIVRVSLTQNAVRPSLYEKELASLASRISNGENQVVEDVRETIKRLDEKGSTAEVVNDKEFINELSMMATKSIPKSKFLLAGLENNYKEDMVATLEECQICHVLPIKESMWPLWSGFKGMNSIYCNRLGNKMLLEKGLHEQVEKVQSNLSLSDAKQFSKIKKLVGKSKYHYSRAIAEYDQWEIDSVEARQHALAESASTIWSFK